ncbi:MAG: dephospho-CoA kinase [Steroidobacteraceae bacterium]
MSPRLRIGLTGGIASGKSTVAQRFLELGVPVIDADESARSVVACGSPGLAEVIRAFGTNMLTENGELDRRALRNLIFADPERRRELESILHPLIQADMESRAAAAVGPYVVMAIPLLVEGGRRDRVHRLLVVDVDEQTQLQRLMARDGGTRQQAEAILAAQASRASRLKAADDVLLNAGTVPDLRHAVDQLHQRYLSLSETLAARDGHLT